MPGQPAVPLVWWLNAARLAFARVALGLLLGRRLAEPDGGVTPPGGPPESGPHYRPLNHEDQVDAANGTVSAHVLERWRECAVGTGDETQPMGRRRSAR